MQFFCIYVCVCVCKSQAVLAGLKYSLHTAKSALTWCYNFIQTRNVRDSIYQTFLENVNSAEIFLKYLTEVLAVLCTLLHTLEFICSLLIFLVSFLVRTNHLHHPTMRLLSSSYCNFIILNMLSSLLFYNMANI